jgi:anthranilate phosphoribosyltransferase
MTAQQAIRTVAERVDLSEDQARQVAAAIIAGHVSPIQIAGLLVGLRLKGETVDEMVGFARAMREAAAPLRVHSADVVDSCGTGGDGKGTFNISTVSAFVAAGAGCVVAKHGNRWISGRCGSADVLEALGVKVEVPAELAARCIDEAGIGFLYAPLYHAGTRHAAEARRQIGIRSLFNILGPLSNPAGARRQLVGVFERGLTRKVAEALARLGAVHALVVHGADGLDEFTPADATFVSELKDGRVSDYEVTPEQLGVERVPLERLRGGDPQTNARIAREILAGRPLPASTVVALNAGAVIYVGGRAESLREGVAQAWRAIESGAALARLEELVQRTQGGS